MLALLVAALLLAGMSRLLGSPFSERGLRRWLFALLLCAVLLGGGLSVLRSLVGSIDVRLPSTELPSAFVVGLFAYVALAIVGFVAWRRADASSGEPRLRARRRARPEPPHRQGGRDA